MWLPSLNFGVGYTHHEGQIQATNGVISQVSRNSVFAGGWPCDFGSSIGRRCRRACPFGRGFVDGGRPVRTALSMPVSQCRTKYAGSAFNDTLYQAAAVYYELVRAQVGNKVAFQNFREAEEVLETTEAFVESGKGAEADISRLKVFVQNRRQTMFQAKGRVGVASSNLARTLQLDPDKLPNSVILMPVDQTAAPVAMVDVSPGIDGLVHTAVFNRPEMRELAHRICAANLP